MGAGKHLRRAVAGVVLAAVLFPSAAFAEEIVIGESDQCRGYRFGWEIDSSDPGATRVWVDPGKPCFTLG
jgi:hypothetical protein